MMIDYIVLLYVVVALLDLVVIVGVAYCLVSPRMYAIREMRKENGDD